MSKIEERREIDDKEIHTILEHPFLLHITMLWHMVLLRVPCAQEDPAYAGAALSSCARRRCVSVLRPGCCACV